MTGNTGIKLNLQFFGAGFTPEDGGADEQDYVTSGADEGASTDEGEGTQDEGETSSKQGETDDSADEKDTDDASKGEKDTKESKEPDDNTPWVKRRLARAERSFERRFMEEVNGASYGHEVPRQDLPKAAALWNMLRANPELSSKLNQMINEEVKSGKAKSLDNIQPTSGYDAREARLAMRETKLELRETDPVFRKYEQDILEWAEEEGLRVRSDRELKSAVREWKGAHARMLSATPPAKKPPATPQTPPAKSAPTGSKTPGGTPPPNYRKMSATELLKHDGLRLTTDD